MLLGIFAKTFPGAEPIGVLNAVAAAGFVSAQYNLACSGLPSMSHAVPASAALAVANAARAAGVELCALSGTYNMIHPDRVERERGHVRLAIVAEAARDMGAPLVTLCTGTRDPHDQWKAHPDNGTREAWSDLIEAMKTAIEIADRFDLDLGVEPELANVIDSAEKARRLIDELGSRRVKIVLDPANLFERAEPAEQRRIVGAAIDLLADRIVMGHAKDRAADGGFAAAGSGVLDYPFYLAALKRIGFSGPLVTHGLSAAEAPGVARFLRRALADAGVEPKP
jgi:sugar phosphate isomerase/epimerase